MTKRLIFQDYAGETSFLCYMDLKTRPFSVASQARGMEFSKGIAVEI